MFTTASTIKLALAATVMHQVEAGDLALSDPAVITSQGKLTPGFLGKSSAKSLIGLMRGQQVKTKLGAKVTVKVTASPPRRRG